MKFQRQPGRDWETTEYIHIKMTIFTCLPISLQAGTLKIPCDRQKCMTLLQIQANIHVKNVLRNLLGDVAVRM